MSFIKSNKKAAVIVAVLLAVIALVIAALTFSDSSKNDEVVAEEEVPTLTLDTTASLAPISNGLSIRFDNEVAALTARNGEVQTLLNNTAGKVLDDQLRVNLQAALDQGNALAATPKPGGQIEVAQFFGKVADANAAYDAAIPAVNDNHQAWVVANTPKPAPKPTYNNGGSKKKSNNGGGGGSRKPSNSGGGGGSSSGGGGGTPPAGGWHGGEYTPCPEGRTCEFY